MGTVATVTHTGGELAGLADALAAQCRRAGPAAVLVETASGALAPPDSEENAAAADRVGRVLQRAGLPSVIAVRGSVRGAGLAVMLHFDLVVCHPEVSVSAGSAVPVLDCGLAWSLRQALGPAQARAMLLGGRALAAAEAQQWGLVAEVDPECEVRAAALATSWASSPAAGLLRRALDAAGRLPAAESRQFDRELSAIHAELTAS